VPPIIPIDRFETFASGLDHPECVAFDRDGNLWAGGEAGQVYRISRDAKVQQVADLKSFNAGVAFSPEDELFVCNPAQGVVRVRRDGSFEKFGDHPMTCANFAVFGSSGNLYVTDSGQWMKQNGFLCRFTPDGRAEIIAGPFGYANGLVLSADERQIFMVESNTNRVFRFDLATMQPEVFAENVGRMPDGLALDIYGDLYVSCYASDEIHRIGPTGKVDLFAHDPWAIKLSRPTNMAFRGETMYVANLGRQTITRANVGVVGETLVNCR
jgi:gluconolactonase